MRARALACCILVALLLFPMRSLAAGGPSVLASRSNRTNLVEAVLSEDPSRQFELIKAFALSGDPFVEQALTAWRGGSVYIFQSGENKIPFLLDSQTDADGKAKAIKLIDGSSLLDEAGKPLLFAADSASTDAPAADTNAKLRKAIKTTLGQEQNPDYIAFLEPVLKTEKSSEVIKAVREAIALIHITSEDESIRVPAVETLGKLRSIGSLVFLQKLRDDAKANPNKFGEQTTEAVRIAIRDIEEHIRYGNLFGTAFRGISLAAVLLVAALGLAITFGLMGVINMAHGELMMVGAYSAYVTQNLFRGWFGAAGTAFDSYFVAALGVSFGAAALVGIILERGVIRFLYRRPLESLLATWGVSLVLQQVFRHIFGAANVQVNSPSWLSGSFVVSDVLLAYNRIFVICFAFFVVLLTYCLLTRTSLGLQIRAVMQNRAMASALGVRTERVNMLTFAFGSGLAGMAGACLSQIGNVGPSLGQNYIVDCFMIVVLGGVGNLVGTVSASFGVGVTDQILQPWLGAVLGKITVLAAIILFLQWRPAGLFVTRSRSLEG